VFKQRLINILSNQESNDLPEFDLVDNLDVDIQINSYLKSKLNLMSNWLDIKLFSCKVINGVLHIFYSTWVPESFLNKETKYLNLSEFKDSDAILTEIANSLRVKPY
jgi:hypothetical protein